ncbi:unnamed protein product [Didymodactylos carnosus]|uniref:Uncharacterized protein n=1 Tax=Didymodactylos carnosus TaxID=1234261 RepID=A0A814A1K0_9BILA|nr:unnamed protein product [Didymodactylos carnosus]CAF0930318.1 unnamed protein product [Didymodactylos carnosus]CAF3687452.1 unnamed protein product [Didymodactylos carnosus]CAF3707007.1 unnamed protein product [Didymodactylos carnosus]
MNPSFYTTVQPSIVQLLSTNDANADLSMETSCQTDATLSSDFRIFHWLYRVQHLHEPIPYYQMSIISAPDSCPQTSKSLSDTTTQTDFTTTITNPVTKAPIPLEIYLNEKLTFRNHDAILETHVLRNSLPSEI